MAEQHPGGNGVAQGGGQTDPRAADEDRPEDQAAASLEPAEATETETGNTHQPGAGDRPQTEAADEGKTVGLGTKLRAGAVSFWNAVPGWLRWLIIKPVKGIVIMVVGAFVAGVTWDCSTNGCKDSLELIPGSVAQALNVEEWTHHFTMPGRDLPEIRPARRFNTATQLFASYSKELEAQEGDRRLVFEPKSLALTRICRPFEVRTISVEATFRAFMHEFRGCFTVDYTDGKTDGKKVKVRANPASEIEEPVDGLFYCRCHSSVFAASDRPPLNRRLLKVLPF